MVLSGYGIVKHLCVINEMKIVSPFSEHVVLKIFQEATGNHQNLTTSK